MYLLFFCLLWTSHCAASPCSFACCHPNKKSPGESVWNQLCRQIMNITSQAKETIRWVITIWRTSFFAMSDENSGCERSRRQGMEEARNDSSLAVGQCKEKKRGHVGRTKRPIIVHFATLMDICHFKKCKVRTRISVAQKKSCALWWHCERRLCSLCSLYSTGLVCVSHDSGKGDGRHCKIITMWSKSPTQFSIHSAEDGSFQISQNTNVWMSRCMDTSSTT